MRLSVLLVVLLALPACSLTDSGAPVDYREVAEGSLSEPVQPPVLLRSQADLDAFAETYGVGFASGIDFSRETVVVIASYAGCPASNYTLTVTGVEREGPGIHVESRIDRVGDGGFDVATHPLAAIAVVDLPSVRVGDVDEFPVQVSVGDASGDCIRR